MEGLAGEGGGGFTAVFWGSRTDARLLEGEPRGSRGVLLIGCLVFHTSEMSRLLLSTQSEGRDLESPSQRAVP